MSWSCLVFVRRRVRICRLNLSFTQFRRRALGNFCASHFKYGSFVGGRLTDINRDSNKEGEHQGETILKLLERHTFVCSRSQGSKKHKPISIDKEELRKLLLQQARSFNPIEFSERDWTSSFLRQPLVG